MCFSEKCSVLSSDLKNRVAASGFILQASLMELLTSIHLSLENYNGSLVFPTNFVCRASSLNDLIAEPQTYH